MLDTLLRHDANTRNAYCAWRKYTTLPVISETFDSQLPDVAVGTEERVDGDGMLKMNLLRPCWLCEQPTAWLSISFDARICSRLCLDILWSGYFAANAASAENYGMSQP